MSATYIGWNRNQTDGKHSIKCYHNNIWGWHNIYINTAQQMWLVHPIMGLAEQLQWCDMQCIVQVWKYMVSSMVHYYGRAMANAHCALYINIWFHIMLCNLVTKYFALFILYHIIYNWLVLLSWIWKFKEVQLRVSVQHPIKYDSLAEHGAVQRSMLFIAKLSFVQFSAVLCCFVKCCAMGIRH